MPTLVTRLHLDPSEYHRTFSVSGLNDTDRIGDITQWKCLSWVRNKPTWVEPTLYDTLEQHPDLPSFLILLKSPDWKRTIAIYPVSSTEADCQLKFAGRRTQWDTPVKAVLHRVVPDREASAHVAVGLFEGTVGDRDIIRKVIGHARNLVHGHKVENEWNEDLWSGLGICTWESFRVPDNFAQRDRPTLDLLLSLVPPETVPIKSFLIDDGWQDVRDRKLVSFEAWSGFGGSLQNVVQALKRKGVQKVGVWLTLQGYWNGIDDNSPLRRQYDCWQLEDRGQITWTPAPSRAKAFWTDYLGSLHSAGVDFIKCDNQAGFDHIDMMPRMAPQAAQAMWSAMLSAVLDVFGSLDHVIMCMSHNARMLGGSGGLNFDRPLGNLYWRNSDDYALNYSQTHTDHVRKNVYMTALSRHLSFKPDFDMFASTPSSAWPTYHALLRCLSPGPILLSDTPRDETDLALLGKMTAKGRNGATQVVKTDTAVQVLPNRLFWDNLAGPGEGPAVVGSVAFPTAQGSLIAAWNCHDPDSRGTAMDTIRMIDVEDALDEVIYDPNSRDLSTRGSRVASSGRGIDGEYAIWSVGHSARNGQKVELVQPGGRLEFGLELRSGECELLVVAKTYVIKGQKVAVVGMLDKIAPLAGVSVSVGHNSLVIDQRYAADIYVLGFGHVNMTASVDGKEIREALSTQMVGDVQLVRIPVVDALAAQSAEMGTTIGTRLVF